ncbi:hypothetical protein EVA_12957 [gut metagenome]|uniref:Uncharacterized protein n=1 Tax=gut metagenome TaxID=749906 RepID=J9FVB0_9ZZZZ
MIENPGKDSARAAGRGCYNYSAACIFFTYRKGVGENQSPCPEDILISLSPYKVV